MEKDWNFDDVSTSLNEEDEDWERLLGVTARSVATAAAGGRGEAINLPPLLKGIENLRRGSEPRRRLLLLLAAANREEEEAATYDAMDWIRLDLQL